jgi:hypothetical protein
VKGMTVSVNGSKLKKILSVKINMLT